MSKHVLDAMLTDVTTFKTYKLSEVTGHVVETQIYRFCGFILMNPDSYAKLPDDLKQIMDEHSGRATSYACGDAWEAGAEEGIALYKEAGATTSTFSDADLAKIGDAAAVARDKWISDMDGMGYEGQAVYDKYVELLAAINGTA